MEKICMNQECKSTTTLEWKRGWGLKSSGFATLCFNCGSAYENLLYCETFHLEESGWRECRICGKNIHCGCIASKYLHDYLDFGGVGCISCAMSLEAHSSRTFQISSEDIPNGFATLATNNDVDPQSSNAENRTEGINIDNGKQIKKTTEITEPDYFPRTQKGDLDALKSGESSRGFTNPNQQSVESSILIGEPEKSNSRPLQGIKDMYESLSDQPDFTFSLGTPNSVIPFSGGVVGKMEQNKVPPCNQGQNRQRRHFVPKALKSSASIDSVTETRIERPSSGGRARNQLLQRYCPRITDQELRQISGGLNTIIVPLFEKVLSASDAGRIGRLVLPKACAEAYFPHISEAEGIPIRIQDIKGKEWTLQFRYWPNNNSRMYVLEGISPCIQNMQLQAGDTVIFSRIDPGGKLVMGFRRASNPVDMQLGQTSTFPSGSLSGETTSLAGGCEDLSTGGGTNKDVWQLPMVRTEKSSTRNIGTKSKRLLMHSEDAMELKLTLSEGWELTRQPSTVNSTIVMVEDCEFEEFKDSPVVGMLSVLKANQSGEQEQWARCHSCSKWRKLPWHVLLPPKWTCLDNIWDSSRCSCTATEDGDPMELDRIFKATHDLKMPNLRESPKVAQDDKEPSGLDALATAAVSGVNVADPREPPSGGATTKHPRHLSGCTCIVCIQPPSGGAKHEPTCMCNVCMAVRRRFETLMLKKKKKLLEAEIASRKDQTTPRGESEMESTSGNALLNTSINPEEEERNRQSGIQMDVVETNKGKLDLNFHPNSEEDILAGPSMTSLVHATSIPLEMYMRHN